MKICNFTNESQLIGKIQGELAEHKRRLLPVVCLKRVAKHLTKIGGLMFI